MLSIDKLFSVLYITIALLTSGYVLTTTSYSLGIYLLCLFGVVAFLLRSGTRDGLLKKIKVRIVLLFMSVTLIPAFLSLIANPSVENAVSLIKLILALGFGSVLYLSFDFYRFKALFANAVFVICVISLPGYFITNFTDILTALPLIQNVNDVGFRFAFFFFAYDGFLHYRNIGIFWEPGIFASMIFYVLVADLYNTNKVGSMRTTVLLITLITTFSSAALILFLVYVFLLIAKPVERVGNNLNSKIFAIFAVIISAVILSMYVADNFPDEFIFLERITSKITESEDMQQTRLLSPAVSLEVFAERPIFGWGLNGALEKYGRLNNEIALTSTSTYLIAAFGIFGAFFTLMPIIGVARIPNLNFATRALLVFAFLFIINKEPHTYFTLTYAMLLYIFAESVKITNRRSRLNDQIRIFYSNSEHPRQSCHHLL